MVRFDREKNTLEKDLEREYNHKLALMNDDFSKLQSTQEHDIQVLSLEKTYLEDKIQTLKQ